MQLSEMLRPHAKAKGPGFLKYDESEKKKDAAVQPEKIQEQADIMIALANSKPIAKSKILEALKELHNENQEQWKIKPEALADWEATMCRRIANSQHVLHQAKGKSTQPKWYKTLMAADEEEEAPLQQDFEYNFDKELGVAYRVKVGSKKNDKDIAKEIKPQEPHQPILGVWPDGAHEIVCMTGQRYSLLKDGQANKSAASDVVLWSGQHSESNNNLRVKERPDRGLLISLMEQANQVCQVHVDLFENDDWRKVNRPGTQQSEGHFDVPNTDTARAKAGEFMVEIAEKYAAGEIEKANLYKHRDEQLRALGFKKAARRKAPAKSKKTAEAAPEPNAEAAPEPNAEAGPEAKVEAAPKRQSVWKKPPAAVPEDPEPELEQEEVEEEDDDDNEDEEASVEIIFQRPAATMKTPDWSSIADSMEAL